MNKCEVVDTLHTILQDCSDEHWHIDKTVVDGHYVVTIVNGSVCFIITKKLI